MINKELDDIMTEYIDKVKKFCDDYEKAVLSREHNIFSLELEKIYSNLESELWRLKHDTEELLSISNDRFICCDMNNHILNAHNLVEVKKELDGVQHDLNAAHLYFLNRCGADIAEGLAEKWRENALCAGFEIVKSGLKYVIKAGIENDD